MSFRTCTTICGESTRYKRLIANEMLHRIYRYLITTTDTISLDSFCLQASEVASVMYTPRLELETRYRNRDPSLVPLDVDGPYAPLFTTLKSRWGSLGDALSVIEGTLSDPVRELQRRLQSARSCDRIQGLAQLLLLAKQDDADHVARLAHRDALALVLDHWQHRCLACMGCSSEDVTELEQLVEMCHLTLACEQHADKSHGRLVLFAFHNLIPSVAIFSTANNERLIGMARLTPSVCSISLPHKS